MDTMVELAPPPLPLPSHPFLSSLAYFLHFFPSSNTHHVSIEMLAGQIITPLDDGSCHLTTVCHINPGGAADNAAGAAIINVLCARDPVALIEAIRQTLKDAALAPHGELSTVV